MIRKTKGVAAFLIFFAAPVLVHQTAFAVPVSFDGGNQASAGASPFNPLLIDPLAPAAGGYEIGSSSPIVYDYSPGAGRFTWTLQDTAGVVGSPIPASTTYAIIQYATVGSGGSWTGWYAGMSECCWQVQGVDVIDTSTNMSVSGLSFVNDAGDRSVTYSFDPLASGTILEIHNIMVYTMPVPLVTDGDKLLHTAPLTAIPVPAALWLMGSALGVLRWMRRREAAGAAQAAS